MAIQAKIASRVNEKVLSVSEEEAEGRKAFCFFWGGDGCERPGVFSVALGGDGGVSICAWVSQKECLSIGERLWDGKRFFICLLGLAGFAVASSCSVCFV